MIRLYVPIILEVFPTIQNINNYLEDKDDDFVNLIKDESVSKEDKIEYVKDIILQMIESDMNHLENHNDYGINEIVIDKNKIEHDYDDNDIYNLAESYVSGYHFDDEGNDWFDEQDTFFDTASQEEIENYITQAIDNDDRKKIEYLLYGYPSDYDKKLLTDDQKQRLKKAQKYAKKISTLNKELLLEIDNTWMEESSKIIAELAAENPEFEREMEKEESDSATIELIDYYLTNRLIKIKSELLKEDVSKDDLDLLLGDLLSQFKTELSVVIKDEFEEE